MKKLTAVFLICTGSAGFFSCTAQGDCSEIPEAGRIRLDGRLDDWDGAVWHPLTANLKGDPVHLSGTEWSAAWSDKAVLFIAVRCTDSDLVLKDRFSGFGAQDCVEIFVRGDAGSLPSDYAETQESAQHYIFGLSDDRKTVWKRMGNLDRFPRHNPARAAIRLEENSFIYEMMIPLYDRFHTVNPRRTSETEVYPEVEIGLDIYINDAGAKGFAGTRATGGPDGKRSDAGLITLRILTE